MWTGSHNLTSNSLRQSDETLLQLEDPAVHDAYVRQYNKLRAATTHQPANGTPIACPRTPGVDRSGGALSHTGTSWNRPTSSTVAPFTYGPLRKAGA
ncbi:hypothetical protein GCM10022244_50380 [Streptomyces gulbargensis]|uniref:Phospholipase D-like domain-containing protein n=1 Tax=Streptomyces gulbargensis TaxID=364901 RepID=A0ABP7N5H7_9ACTN